MGLTEIILSIIFFAVGFAIAYFMGQAKISRAEERHSYLEKNSEALEQRVQQQTERADSSAKELAALRTEYRLLQERLTEQKEELKNLQSQFRDEFKNLANDILEEKSKKFTEQNREKIDQILKPLGEKISEFQKRVEENHREDLKGRSALGHHLKMLQELNQKMSDEAKNLTKALKSDSKQQGNWGEVILQRILEKSGLRKGEEYHTQENISTIDGRKQQPDVIVQLPDEKRLIIDSKVSLKAYEKYTSSEDPKEQETAVLQHVQSLRNHVKGLSGKNYEKLYGSNSPDFVLMFIPIEPAFGVAMQHAPDIYNEAFEKNIIIVSPTTLLATLATINNVWKQEYQNRNAMEIASRGAALYEKFVGFVESMNDIGNRISQTQKSYDTAMKRLSEGSGNLVRQAEMLRELGAQTSKVLPGELVRKSLDGETAGNRDNDE